MVAAAPDPGVHDLEEELPGKATETAGKRARAHARLCVALRDAHLLELLLPLLLVLGVKTAGFTNAHPEESLLAPRLSALLAEPLVDDEVVPEPEKVMNEDSSSPGRGVAKSVANSTR